MTFQETLLCTWRVMKREVKRITSRPIYLFGMIGAPLICLIFFISLMRSGLPYELPIAVVDMDNSADSRNLIRQLDVFEQTQVYIKTQSFQEGREAIQKGEVYGIFYIPEGFASKVTSGRRPKISFYTNASYLIAASLLFRDMKTISILAGGAVGLKTGQAKGYTDKQIMAQVQPIVIDTHPLGNPNINYSVYLNNTILPGILQLMIFIMTVFSIGSELKYATSREWVKTGGNSFTASLVGKLFPHTVIFFFVGMLIISILYGYNAFPLQSGWGPMMLDMLLLILAAQCCGILMISTLPTLRLGLSFACLFGMVSFSIVGFSFPTPAMDPMLQSLALLFPLRHYYLIYVDQALNGRAMFYSMSEYLWLVGFFILPVIMGRHLKAAMLYFKYIP
jgi:ABC-2 type transport system permease protein